MRTMRGPSTTTSSNSCLAWSSYKKVAARKAVTGARMQGEWSPARRQPSNTSLASHRKLRCSRNGFARPCLAPRLVLLPDDDIVHGDLNPSNVLVRDGQIVAVIDTGSAGRGSRAIDLATVVWGTPMGSRAEDVAVLRLLTVAPDGAVVALALHIWHMLEFPIRHQRGDIVRGVVFRAHHVLDRLADA